MSGINAEPFFPIYAAYEASWNHYEKVALEKFDDWDKIDAKLDKLKNLLTILSADRMGPDGKEVKQIDYSKTPGKRALIDEMRAMLNEDQDVPDEFFKEGCYSWPGSKISDMIERLNEQEKSLTRKLNMIVLELTDIKQKQNLMPELLAKLEERIQKTKERSVSNQAR